MGKASDQLKNWRGENKDNRVIAKRNKYLIRKKKIEALNEITKKCLIF